MVSEPPSSNPVAHAGGRNEGRGGCQAGLWRARCRAAARQQWMTTSMSCSTPSCCSVAVDDDVYVALGAGTVLKLCGRRCGDPEREGPLDASSSTPAPTPLPNLACLKEWPLIIETASKLPSSNPGPSQGPPEEGGELMPLSSSRYGSAEKDQLGAVRIETRVDIFAKLGLASAERPSSCTVGDDNTSTTIATTYTEIVTACSVRC